MLSLVTIAAVPEHRCFIDGIDTNSSIAAWNSTGILEAIPLINGELDSCNMFMPGTNETTSCSQYVYDDTFYKDTRSMDWNMVCDNRFRGAIAQTVYMLGVFTGAVTLGKANTFNISGKNFIRTLFLSSRLPQVGSLIKLVARRFSVGQQRFS